MLLDEASAAQDSQNEKNMHEALFEIAKERCVLMIAHRLSTVIMADEILVLDQGRIVEKGTHQSLLKQKGLYNDMVQQQLLDH
jgi:ABC-type multidrug transport system fused ATPase/permease subunit